MQELIEISNASITRRYQLVSDAQNTNCCNWMGITCEEGTVREIEWNFSAPKGFRGEQSPTFFALEWLPGSLRIVDMSHLPINSTLQTRKLPKELMSGMFQACGLHGSIDCRTFPSNL